MIFAHLHHTQRAHHPRAIAQAIDWLSTHDLPALPAGCYQDSETGWQVQVLDLYTAAHAENYPEAHRHHIDVQYLVHGEELIGVATHQRDLPVHQPYDEQRDIIFFRDAPGETLLHMQPGHFAVFFPQDIHRPNCAPQAPAAIRKVVIKIPVTALAN